MNLERKALKNGNKKQAFIIRTINKVGNSFLGTPTELRIIGGYKEGKTQLELTEEFLQEVIKKYGLDVAKPVAFYIIKHSDNLTNEQRNELRYDHCRNGGKKAHRLRMGVHGMSANKRRSIGKDVYELGLGIHGLTKEEKSKNAREGARNSAKSRGQHPWNDIPCREDFVEGENKIDMPEIAYAYNQRLDKIPLSQVIDDINEKWNYNRNNRSLINALYRFRESLDGQQK
ncbi:MAG: hypothetical protein QGF74_01875 [Candidatus Nanoarchaeia archaeon]|jgi:hypothetical protein|nr:hypothetical protein [Candidatus Nanoarchaeia archaeon]|tara:strand:+ start:24222 stop:24911 length:690 start_codon:yes stop_codon:yes gene_type:complete